MLRRNILPASSNLKMEAFVLRKRWDLSTSLYCTKEQSSPATRHGGAWGERRYSSYSFLTSALDGGEWSASRPGRALPRGKTPGTHCTGGWVGLGAGLDTEDRGKSLWPCRGSNPDRPVVQYVVRHYTDWATPSPYIAQNSTRASGLNVSFLRDSCKFKQDSR
jgi:hypothetical protein